MRIFAIKCHKIKVGEDIFKIFDKYLPKLKEKDIVVITSKIISLCQKRVIFNDGKVDKDKLIRKEADWYISDPKLSQYHVTLTIKDGILIASSGIDESNGGGYFVLWPANLAKVTAEIWQYLRKKHQLKHLGVMVTDSRLTPLRWGTIGVGMSWCGFQPLKNYIGEPDIHGRKLRMTKESILDGLAAAANLVMGEGDEQTPLAIISQADFVEFTDKPPTAQEIASLQIDRKDDMFSPLTNSPKWQKGG